MFFVLSGFLITRLLLDEHDQIGSVSLRSFYARRLLRLYPALVAVVAFVLLVALATREQIGAIGQGALAALFYVANFWIDTGHDTVLLQHTWTLALEEQFHLLWPPLLVALWLASPRGLAVISIVLGGPMLAVAVLAVTDHVAPAGHTYLRASGLAMGCGLAWLTARRKVQINGWWGTAAGALLLVLLAPVQLPRSC